MIKESDIMLKTSSLSISFKKTQVLQDITLDINQNGMYFFVGDSGCGKTTLLNVLSGFLTPKSGAVYYDNIDIYALSKSKRNKLIREQSGFIFQNYNLISGLTAYENILIGIKYQNALETQIDAVLQYLNIFHLKNKKVDLLSGGEMQRVAIARSIIKKNNIIFADEPSGNLDNTNATKLFDYLYELSKNKIVIIVTHDLNIAQHYANKIFFMKSGIVIEEINNPVTHYTSKKYRIKGSDQLLSSDALLTAISNQNNVEIEVVETTQENSINFNIQEIQGQNQLKMTEICKLMINNILRKKVHMFVSFLLILFSTLAMVISLSFIDYKTEDTVYRLFKDNNHYDTMFYVSKKVTYSGKGAGYFNILQTGKYLEDTLQQNNFNFGKVYNNIYVSNFKTNYIKLADFTDLVIEGALPLEDEVLITDYLSHQLFGDGNYLHKVISLKGKEYKISGIVKTGYQDYTNSYMEDNYYNNIYGNFLLEIKTEMFTTSPFSINNIVNYTSDIPNSITSVNQLKENEIIVSTEMLKFYGLQVGKEYPVNDIYDKQYNGFFYDKIDLKNTLGDRVKVVATFEDQDHIIIINESIYQKMYQYYHTYCTYNNIIVLGTDLKQTIYTLYNMGLEIENEMMIHLFFLTYVANITFLLKILLVISSLIFLFSIINLSKTIISSRIKDIGIMKSLGISNKSIFLYFILTITLFILTITIVVLPITAAIINLISTALAPFDMPQFKLFIVRYDHWFFIGVCTLLLALLFITINISTILQKETGYILKKNQISS